MSGWTNDPRVQVRIEHRLLSRSVLPHDSYVALLLTLRCNQRCRHCIYFASPSRSEMMSRSVLERAVYLCSSMSFPPRVYFSGGEPTVHPACADLLESALHMGLPIRLATNARWVPSAHNGISSEYNAYIELLVSSPNMRLRFTVDDPHLREDPLLPQRLEVILADERVRKRMNQVVFSINARRPDAAVRLAQTCGLLRHYTADELAAMWNVLLDRHHPPRQERDFVIVSPWGDVFRNNWAYKNRANPVPLDDLPAVVEETRASLREIHARRGVERGHPAGVEDKG